jgi:hypothetical protein
MVKTLEFTTSKGNTLKIDRQYIEETIHNRAVTGEIISDDGLLIDMLIDGAYLIMDMNYHVNRSLVDLFTTSFDATKQFALSFTKNTTTNTYTLSEALKEINYTGTLPITDLKDIFCTVFNLQYRSGLSTTELINLMESVYDRKVAGLPPVVIPPIPVVPTTNELTTLMGSVFDAKYAALPVIPANKKPFIYVYRIPMQAGQPLTTFTKVQYNSIYKKVGTGVDFNTTSSTFSIANPGMYTLTASISCTNTNPMTLIYLAFRRLSNNDEIIAQNSNLGTSDLLQTSVYFGPNDFTYPITDLVIEWGHNSQTEQVGIAAYANNFHYTFAILQFVD